MADPLVPAGRVRLDFAPSYWSWDRRFGITPGGDAESEKLGDDLADPDGTALFPGLTDLQEELRGLLDDGSYEARLGETRGSITREMSRIDTGLRVGVFDWFTVGVTVPWVKGRTAVDVAFRPAVGADLGLNPRLTDEGSVDALLSSLSSAAAAAAAYASSVCGSDPGDPCGQAQALAGRASSFRDRAQAAYSASPFFPSSDSETAISLAGSLTALSAALVDAGLPGIATGWTFAEGVMSTEGLSTLATDPAAGIRGGRLETWDGLWAMGDVEVSAGLRLLRGEVRDSGAVRPRFAYGLSAGGMVRLGTGTVDSVDVLLDMGSGDGQMDMEGRVDGFVQVGSRLDVRGGFRYGVQQAVTLARRVGPHEEVLVPIGNTRTVVWTPGDYTYIDVSPRYRLTPDLSLAVDYRRYHKGEDAYEIFGDQAFFGEAVDVGLLSHETEMTAQEVAVGVRYSTMGSWREGLGAPPLEMGVRLVRTVAGAGGNVPKATRLEFSMSVFKRIWGRP
jgi:hypothetical protein